jgi:hypothetical protein
MLDTILADEHVSLFALIIISTALVIALLELTRSYFITKRAELRLANEALERHFAALKKVTDDDVVSDDVKRLLLQISTAFSRKQIAKGIAESIKSGKKRPLSPEKQRALETVMEELMMLLKKREDIAEAIVDTVNYGFASMVLRWPETEIMMARALMLDAATTGRSAAVRQKTACVLAQVQLDVLAVPTRAMEQAYS